MENFFKCLKKTENLFLIICLFFGILFTIITPPFMVSDENSHMAKMYNFTEGSINFQKLTVSGGGQIYAVSYLPENLKFIITQYEEMPFDRKIKTSFDDTKSFLKLPLNKNEKKVHFYYIPSYTIFSYMPGVIILFFLKLFNVNPLVMMYILRLSSLAAYIALTYFAIRITPVKKWLFFMCALIPTMIYTAAGVNTDGLIAGLCFLYTAYVFNLVFNTNIKNITKKDLIITLLLISYITVCKFPYAILILLMTLIPEEKFSYKAQKFKYIVFPCIGFFLYTLLNTLYNRYLYAGVSSLNPYLKPVGFMLHTMIFHPDLFLKSVFSIFEVSGLPVFGQTIGAFSWQNRFIPISFIFWYYVFLFTGAVFKDKKECISEYLLIRNKLLYGICYSGFVIMTIIVCYLLFSRSEYDTIKNFQGRYLIPVLPLFLMLFSTGKTINYKVFKGISLIFIIFILFIFSVNILVKFYI